MLDDSAGDIIDAHPPRGGGRRAGLLLLLVLFALLIGGGTALSYYVDALWFGSLGYADVFWKTLDFQSAIFGFFTAATFAALYGAFLALKPTSFGTFGSDEFLIVNGRPVRLPVGPVLRVMALLGSLVIALGTGAGMGSDWPTFALWWYGRLSQLPAAPAADHAVDPIFGRPIAFYLFTLPAWERIAGWLMTIAILSLLMAAFFGVVTAGGEAFRGRAGRKGLRGSRGLALTWAFVLLALAAQIWLGRFERLFDDHTIFAGVTYTEAHVTLTGMLVVSIALVAGAGIAAAGAFRPLRLRWLAAAILPAAACYLAAGAIGGYVNGFIVKPNELVREQPYISNNITFTRQAYGLNRIAQRAFPAETTIEAADPAANQSTLQNIRLWDWRVLQDTLRQLQEIRTYYDFPDIDIDRYVMGGQTRQVMLATRELNVTKLPESSRNWINEKLIYTHGYGVTMNYVNGFTPEGLPTLLLRDMPVQSTAPGLNVTRPEIYFGEMTDTDVYVKTRQQEFNYPQGQTNSLTSYAGSGGIVLGGFFRRLLIAFDRGDIGKLPFSDDVTAESRLLMRRNVRARAAALAPFLTFDPDPYIVIGADGRLSWIMDAFTVSDRYPYSRAYTLEGARINYLRNSVKAVVDAYNGTTTFYVFDAADPIVAAYRAVFPSLFKDASAMPADLRAHIRYPELLLTLQAEVYGLYHMTNPEVFYNREDLWTVATDVATTQQRDKEISVMEPNFVLMTLPGESNVEFVEMLPFSPANRNNLIGWIAGRSDGDHYGDAIVYDFPKTRLVDGPLQIEARIDQNAQLSGQLSLWNQQGSHVRRGGLLVIPIGRALLYAEAIYLQAERSPMPELRLVVLAMQDRLAYAPTFEAALAGLFGAAAPGGAGGVPAAPPSAASASPTAPAAIQADVQELIARASKDLSDYQRLTAEGRLAEAGQKLEELKKTLDELNNRRR
ncbi:MAG TPA: UPF0182 family protein [Vicinamibacterales bacterium]|nr:UPF0182 family protein [Vicinamibacterales bacterium]